MAIGRRPPMIGPDLANRHQSAQTGMTASAPAVKGFEGSSPFASPHVVGIATFYLVDGNIGVRFASQAHRVVQALHQIWRHERIIFNDPAISESRSSRGALLVRVSADAFSLGRRRSADPPRVRLALPGDDQFPKK
jgi:hypothetical protein